MLLLKLTCANFAAKSNTMKVNSIVMSPRIARFLAECQKPSSNGKKLEIERRFLVKEVPKDLKSYPHVKMEQGYVVQNGDEMDFRLRKESGKYFLTVKTSTKDPRVRNEPELDDLTKEEFDELWTHTEGKRIKKVRYYIPADRTCKNDVYELDEFKKQLKGLYIVEAEFDSLEDCTNFSPPDWFGKEVTNDPKYRSKQLAIHGLPR